MLERDSQAAIIGLNGDRCVIVLHCNRCHGGAAQARQMERRIAVRVTRAARPRLYSTPAAPTNLNGQQTASGGHIVYKQTCRSILHTRQTVSPFKQHFRNGRLNPAPVHPRQQC